MSLEGSLPLRSSLERLGERLDQCGVVWLVGGSCGLLLQGVEVAKPPRDIDLYVNGSGVRQIHERLRDWVVDEPKYSETPIYRSTLSHYDLAGHTLEVVGGFEVETLGSLYRVDVELLERFAAEVPIEGHTLKLMPLAHELLFNLLRARPDRYEAVAAVMRMKPDKHEPALKELLRMGSWSEDLLLKVQAAREG